MSSNTPNDERPRDAARPVDSSRREFLGRSAAMAAAVVGAPALLAACDGDSATGPAEARASAPEGASRALQGADPWWVLHGKIAATVGSASDVQVPALEQVTGGYLQRVITDNDRVGTGLATILRSSHKFSTANGTVGVTVSVQTSYGKRYYARTLYKQADLVYAVRDALATNTLADGVLQESLYDGNPVVAAIKASVVQFAASAAPDYYGNHLQVASQSFGDIFNTSVGGFPLAATTRDLARS